MSLGGGLPLVLGSDDAPPTTVADRSLLGVDVLFMNGTRQITAKRDYVEIDGPQNVALSFNRRLMADPGSMSMRPEYGGGLRNWVNKPDTASNRAHIAQIVRDQATQERRIAALKEVSVTTETLAGKLCTVVRYLAQLIDGRPLAGELAIKKEL